MIEFAVSAASDAALERLQRLPENVLDIRGVNAWRVFERSVALSEAVGELEHIVGELKGTRCFRHIRVLLKTYVVGWSTLSDVAAGIINDALGLGYGDKDISFGAVL